MLHYADDSPGHAGSQSHPKLELVSQPCFAAQYRSMSEVECRSMSGGYRRVGMGGRQKSSLGRRWKVSVGRLIGAVVDRCGTFAFADGVF
ncbi:hypothetical protein F2Q70_00030820 [Brassica cretica]|uniref:Uncharacterized protein n=1 Tax=Brassica cretica TaxID=69181 RepID=A0A8S9FLL8_BRACR|nr:hypothetical protein F2Q70_00030820 [Brassica cretica]